jgi:hypothetical protein
MDISSASEGQIFISYARKDRKTVDWIVRQLAAAGFQIWIDRRDIPGGAAWAAELEKAIIEAEALVLMLSPNSIASTWVLKELQIANQNNVRITPLVLRPIEPAGPIASEIDGIQQIVFWRRRQKSIVDLINALGGLRGVAAIMPGDSSIEIRESARLIVELLRLSQEVSLGNARVLFLGGADHQYYIQFLARRDSPEIEMEAVGNANLSEDLQLDDESIAMLLALGWQKPNKTSFGNYWRRWQTYTNRDRATVAATVVNTFLRVYRHLPGEELHLDEIDL